MKKFLIVATAIICCCGSLTAQKIYSTKTGQVALDASATVEIKGVNNQVDSKFVDKTGQIVFSVLIKGFKFPNGLMEDHFNENYMESTKFPKADFKGTIANIGAVAFDKDGTYNVTADGTITIHGVGQKISAPGTITIEKGKVDLKAKFKVKLKDFITGSYIGSQIAEYAAMTLNCKYD